MHSIQVDPVNTLVEARLSGFFDIAETQRVIDDVRAAVRGLGDRAGQHLSLYDVKNVEVAPGPTIELLQSAFADPAIRHLWARKVAFVTPSALGRMQLKRLREAREDIGVFASRAEALAWLLA